MISSQPVLSEKTIFDVLDDIWSARIYMLVFSVIMLVFAFIFINFSHRFYKAEMMVAPASPMGQNLQNRSNIGEGSIQVQSDDLQSNAAFLRFEYIYNGVNVASILLKDKKIISGLKSDRNFEFLNGKYDWTSVELSEYLKKRVKLEQVSGKPLRRLTYMHPDSKFAVYMVSRIHMVSDKIIRNSVIKQANGRIIYLNKALSATINKDHRASLVSLLMEQQERLRMMVSLDQPYAATIIEKTFVYSDAKYPDPYMIYPIFLFVGLFLGFIMHGLRYHNE